MDTNQSEYYQVVKQIEEYKAKGEVPFTLVEEFAQACTKYFQAANKEVLKLLEVVKNGNAKVKEQNDELIRQKQLAEGAYLLAWEFLKERRLLDKFKKYLASCAQPEPEKKQTMWQSAISLFQLKKN